MEKRILALFDGADTIRCMDVARALGVSERMARVRIGRLVEKGLLEMTDPSRKARAYRLAGDSGPLR